MPALENKDLSDYELISLDAVKLYNNCDLQKIKEILLKYTFIRMVDENFYRYIRNNIENK